MASDTGIMIIGGPDSTASDAVDLDDMKVNQTVDIDGFGEVTIVKADWADQIGANRGWHTFSSGAEAEYLYIDVRILNTQKKGTELSFDDWGHHL